VKASLFDFVEEGINKARYDMSSSIILIGPTRTGKTTLSKLLGIALKMPAIDLDELRWGYHDEIGYDAAKAQNIARKEGLKSLLNYWKPFSIHAVERVLQDYPVNHVIAFGAWHTIYDDEALLERAKAALEPFKHIILILPSPDVDESYRILRQRHEISSPDFPPEEADKMMEDLRQFMNHPSNTYLATMTVYTGETSSEESCSKIMQAIQ
jgi:hypothetical protein